jgi:hypothetical protein
MEMNARTDLFLEVVLDGVVIADAPCLARGKNCFRLLRRLTLENGRDYDLRVVGGDRRIAEEIQVFEHYRPGDPAELIGDIDFPVTEQRAAI